MSTERRGGSKKGQVYKKRKPYPLSTCQWCGQTGKGNVMIRWHGDNCKQNPANEGKESNDVQRTCPHCGKTMKGQIYFRWHGDNCKHKAEEVV